jgi:hypothetical protein
MVRGEQGLMVRLILTVGLLFILGWSSWQIEWEPAPVTESGVPQMALQHNIRLER